MTGRRRAAAASASVSPAGGAGDVASRPLPSGWRWARLGEVCRVFAGSAAPQGEQYFSDDGPFFFRVSDLGQHGRTTELAQARDRLSPLALDEKSLVMAKRGSVLFPKSGAAIATNNRAMLAVDGYIVSHLMALEPAENVLSEWLYYATCRMDMMNYADNTGYPSLKQSVTQGIAIPLPPLPEQRRIASLLNEQMAAVERARRAAEEMLETVDALKNAFLREIFALGKNLAHGWRLAALGEVCEINPRRPLIQRDDETPTTFVPMAAVDAGSGTVLYPQIRPYGEIKRGYTCFMDGDVLFAKITPCMQNGKHFIAGGLRDGIGFGTTEFHVIRPGAEIIAEWVHYFIRIPEFLTEATYHFTGAVGQQRLPPGYLAASKIPLPPLPEQRRIAGLLNRRMALAEELRLAARARLDAVNALPGALLRVAFAGELR